MVHENAAPIDGSAPDEAEAHDAARGTAPRLKPMQADEPTGGRYEREGSLAAASATTDAEAAAVRDAEAIAARVAADERAADAERDRLTDEPLPVLPALSEQVFQPWPDELIHAERRAAIVERGQEAPLSGGTLYLTSRRLIHVGNEAIEEVDLSRISDMAVALERLLLIELADGSDLAIEVDQPRLLRVQVASARAAIRERSP